MSVKLTSQEFEQRVKSVWGDKVVLMTPYTKSSEKVLVHYNDCNHEDFKNPHKLLSGQGCNQCKSKRLSATKTKTTEDFINDLKSKNLDYEVLSDYKGVKEKIKVKNLSCGHVYSANANNILQGSGCPICHGMKDTDGFKEQIENLYPGEYEILGDYVNNRTKILVRHKCGYEWNVIPKDLLRRYRCPKCLKSYGEYLVADTLDKLGIDYKREVSFDGLKDKRPLKVDFVCYLNGKTYAIEVDGVQHFKDERTIFNSNFEKIEKHDVLKDDYFKSHSIPLLRIPFNWINQKGKIKAELQSFLSI